MSRVAIITARGGSKRIPRKNIRLFHGKPVIAYAISVAQKSGLFDEIMVSTDDQEIADVASKFGAKIPFLRSAENSNDMAGTLDVLKEVLKNYENSGQRFDEMCCLYPISPLIDENALIEACQKLQGNLADFVVPVAKYSTPIQRALKIDHGRLLMADPSNLKIRSQDLAPRYFDVGQFYFAKTEPLLKAESLFSDRTAAYEVDEFSVQDVDNESDWKMLELKYLLRTGSLKNIE
jgi:N-acylneuraminate cytidylyltransferase